MKIEVPFDILQKKYLPIVLWLIFFWTLLLRIILYLNGAEFILDEVNLARNIIERNLDELTLPLSYQQHAPILFLWITKVISILMGFSERTLRVLPFLSGLLGMFIYFNILKQRKYNGFPILLGLLIFGFNIVLIKYSLTFKQYSVDLLISLCWIYHFHSNHVKSKYLLTILAGIVSIFISMPSIFVLCWYVVSGYVHSRENSYVYIGLAWFIIFGINYFVFLHPSVSAEHLQIYHADYFLAFPKDMTSTSYFLGQIIKVFTGIFGKTFVALSLGMGMVVLGWSTNKQNLLLGLPLLLVLVAALVHKYSLIDRLILFVYPFIILSFLEGIQAFLSFIQKSKATINYVGSILLFAMSVVLLASSSRFIYIPSSNLYGSTGLLDGFQTLETTAGNNCQILTHNAHPFHDYYQKIGIIPNTDRPFMSWDHNEVDGYIEKCDTLTIIDIHTFGPERALLEQKLEKYKQLDFYISQDMRIKKIH